MTSLAVLRILTGVRFLASFPVMLVTNPTMALLDIPTSPITTLPYRLFGTREAVVAGLLWTANTPELFKQALLAVTLFDSIDLLSTCAAFLSGNLSVAGTAWASGSIVIFLGVELWALNDLRSQKGAKIE